jgi:hypothetical protein
MPRLPLWSAVIVAGLFSAGCATMNVSSHVEHAVEFTQYHTYDWGPADALPTGDPRLDKNPFFKDHVEGAVNRRLAARGVTLSTADIPDLLIHYHANISTRIDVNRADLEFGYCYDENCRARVVEFEAGTLVLDVIDTRANKVIWRGWAQHSVADMLDNPDRMAQRIEEAVGRMLDRLPIGALAVVPPSSSR